MSEPVFDPLDPAHFLDPFDRLAEARRTCPVSEPNPGLVFVSRYGDVRAGFRDHAHLSNEGAFRLAERSGNERTASVVQLDPPRHTRMRRLLLSAFTPGIVAATEPYIRKLARELVEEVAPRRRADLMVALARPLPALVIAHMVGVPERDANRFMGWTESITAHLPNVPLDLPARAAFNDYILGLLERRRAAGTPPDDLLGRIMEAEVEGERLEDTGIVGSIYQLIVAGQDTVTRLIANCVHELLRDRSLWERVRADQRLVAVAVEESLRHDSPIQWAMRSCKHATEVGGHPVGAGKRVLLGIGSANRDETVFEDPATFSLDRANAASHMAFGHGIHLCLGASLGRSQGRIALETLLELLPDLRLASGFQYELLEVAMTRGPKRLDVVW